MLQPLIQTFPNAKIVGICLADTYEPVARIPVNLRCERVRPPERRKPREVAICRTNRGAMLKSDGSEDRVHDKRAGGPGRRAQDRAGLLACPANRRDSRRRHTIDEPAPVSWTVVGFSG